MGMLQKTVITPQAAGRRQDLIRQPSPTHRRRVLRSNISVP